MKASGVLVFVTAAGLVSLSCGNETAPPNGYRHHRRCHIDG